MLVHYYYPPIRSAGVYRNYYMSVELAKQFDEVYLLTTDNRNRMDNEALSVPTNFRQFAIRTFDFRTIFSYFRKSGHFSEKSKSHVFIQRFLKLQKTIPFNVLIGEGGLWYILSAFRTAQRIIRKHAITHVYTSFAPYADHIIAYLLKLRNPDIKWIADFRDLQVEPIYNNVYLPRLQKKIEKHLLKKANLVTTVSNGLARHLKQYDRPTVAVLRGVAMREVEVEADGKFTICYTGSLFKNFRKGRYFFEILSRLISKGSISKEDIIFQYAGKDGMTFGRWSEETGLADIFINRKYLTRTETLELQNRSHIQLLLTSSRPEWTGVLTGKLFEYIESGNPILAFVSGVRDLEFEALMEDLNAGVVSYEPPIDSDRAATFILEHYNYWKRTGQKKQTLNKDKVAREYGWNQRVSQMLAALS